MSDLLIKYMFPAAISLLALYALFAMTLRNETFFGWNRVFLIIAIAVSFILPLLHIPIRIPSSEQMINYTLIFTDQELLIKADTPEKFSLLSFLALGKQLLFYIYLAGVVVFTLRLLAGLFRILYLIYQYGVVHYQGSKVVFMHNNIPHFSFFNLVFINRDCLETAQEELVLIHEKEHLRQLHFMDLILLELLVVVQWFNPAAWMYRHSLKRIHEYQADHAVLNHGYERTEYICLIFNQISGFRPDVFINKFNFFTLKKRIIMMKRKRTSEWAKSRILLAVPVIALLLLCFGFQANSQENDSNEKAITIKGMVFNFDADELTEFVALSVPQELVTENGQTVTISVNLAQDTIKQTAPDNDEKLFEAFEVEISPEYPGGMEALYKFLGETLIYPMEAREKGIQGKVYVQFIVKKDGSVGNVKIARGLDKLCDEECIRVMKLMPKWTPGQQNGKAVTVNYILPVTFKLSTDDKDEK